jgi:TRAP-type C4-dicarboxylate transport system permease large subunit
MIMMVNLGIGLITPPVGAVLFVGSAVAKLRIEQVLRAMGPFFVHPAAQSWSWSPTCPGGLALAAPD